VPRRAATAAGRRFVLGARVLFGDDDGGVGSAAAVLVGRSRSAPVGRGSSDAWWPP
jgi:hypothetical protein